MYKHEHNLKGEQMLLTNIFFRLELFFATEFKGAQKIGIIVGERAVHILRIGSNQSSPSSQFDSIN
jgi:hypothetical protein